MFSMGNKIDPATDSQGMHFLRSGNGAEEELKFLLDCQRAGLRIYYVPTGIAAVGSQVDNPISTFYHLGIMLDYHDRMTFGNQAVE